VGVEAKVYQDVKTPRSTSSYDIQLCQAGPPASKADSSQKTQANQKKAGCLIPMRCRPRYSRAACLATTAEHWPQIYADPRRSTFPFFRSGVHQRLSAANCFCSSPCLRASAMSIAFAITCDVHADRSRAARTNRMALCFRGALAHSPRYLERCCAESLKQRIHRSFYLFCDYIVKFIHRINQ
jgi:hypothetical protein